MHLGLNKHSRKLNIVVTGGLGNQLFQFFAGLDYAIQTHRNLNLDYSQMHLGFTSRESRIPNEVKTSIKSGTSIYTSEQGGYFQKIYLLVLRFIASRIRAERIFNFCQPKSIGFSHLSKLDKIDYLSGYFQTWKHYQSLKEMDQIGQIQLAPRGLTFEYWRRLISTEKPVVIHVRRGDYKLLSERWGLLSADYFRMAIKIFLVESPQSRILVFSDDLVEARRLLGNFDPIQTLFFPSCEGLTDFEEMLLMGMSDKLIISNSTFSWWAAMLGKTENVIAPSKWFRGMEDPDDLIPENWRRVQSFWE